jgi:hypothetical protein
VRWDVVAKIVYFPEMSKKFV